MVLPAGEYSTAPEGKMDNTHLRYAGAVAFAGLIAAGLWRLGGPYQAVCLPLPALYDTAPAQWAAPVHP